MFENSRKHHQRLGALVFELLRSIPFLPYPPRWRMYFRPTTRGIQETHFSSNRSLKKSLVIVVGEKVHGPSKPELRRIRLSHQYRGPDTVHTDYCGSDQQHVHQIEQRFPGH